MRTPGWLAGKRTIAFVAAAVLLAAGLGFVLTRRSPDPRSVVLVDPGGVSSPTPTEIETLDPASGEPLDPDPVASQSPTQDPREPEPPRANGPSGGRATAISADGRYVAFTSRASNLTTGDTNNVWDVFLRDRTEKRTILISRSTSGAPLDKASELAALSGDGRVVAFKTWETGDPTEDRATDLYVNDLVDRRITHIEIPAAVFDAELSFDGRYMAATAGPDGSVWEVDTSSGEAVRVSVSSSGEIADSPSWVKGISGDGRFVAFEGGASNLVSDDTNGESDVFVHDRISGSTQRVSLDADGNQAHGSSEWAAMSADGRVVAFISNGMDNVEPCSDHPDNTKIYVRDLETGALTYFRHADAPCHAFSDVSLSWDGHLVSIEFRQAGHGDGSRWLWDRSRGSVTQVFECARDDRYGASYEFNAYPASRLASSGEFLVSWTYCRLKSQDRDRALDVYVHDFRTGAVELVSAPDGA